MKVAGQDIIYRLACLHVGFDKFPVAFGDRRDCSDITLTTACSHHVAVRQKELVSVDIEQCVIFGRDQEGHVLVFREAHFQMPRYDRVEARLDIALVTRLLAGPVVVAWHSHDDNRATEFLLQRLNTPPNVRAIIADRGDAGEIIGFCQFLVDRAAD